MVRKQKKKKKKVKPRTLAFRWWMPVAVGLVFASIVALPHFFQRDEETGAMVPPGRWHYGIDLSHHNRTADIRWDSLRVMTDMLGRTTRSISKARTIRPVSFVILKATEGETFRDKKFQSLWEEAASHGIKRGAYHFYRSSKDPLAQADHFIGTVGNLRYTDLPPVLDFETIHRGRDIKPLNEDLGIWLNAVETHYGRTPVIYCPDSFAKDIISREILDKYPVWVAHYGVLSPDVKKWKWWQFTDRAVVYGIHGEVDLSVFQ